VRAGPIPDIVQLVVKRSQLRDTERNVNYRLPLDLEALRARVRDILELRENAKAALGDKFSLKEFHSMVIDTGDVPLEILERQTNAYIARARGM